MGFRALPPLSRRSAYLYRKDLPMSRKQRILGVIPARKGSQRLKDKNKLQIEGKSLVERAIITSLESSSLDKIVVSTDDPDIQSSAINLGVEVPFLRPAEIARATSSSVDVVLHTIKYLKELGEQFSHILLLQPTSPFRDALHIDEAIRLYFDTDARSVISVCKQSHPWKWSFDLKTNGTLEQVYRTFEAGSRTQDAEYYFSPNGALYLISVEGLVSGKTFFPDAGCFGYEMTKLESIDIDDIEDFKLVTALIQLDQRTQLNG